MSNPIGWVEIPVSDMKRAIAFYNEVFDFSLKVNDLGGIQMSWLPFDPNGKGSRGALVLQKEFYKPSNKAGVLIYFSSSDVAVTLDKVRSVGGKILSEKKLIAPDIGYMGLFIDSEGNRIAVHSND
jgi:predicted enzyme related to lactoylglutathione lyase